jgi:hypothetical protein
MPSARPQRRKPLSAHEVATRAAQERHFKTCGEVVWEWNELQVIFGYVFTHLLGPNNIALAPALWHTPSSDKAQRDLLRTAVEWADGVRPSHRDRLKWALDQAGKLAPLRNDIVHGVGGFLISEDGLTTHLSSGRNSFRRVMKHARIDTSLHELMGALCDDVRRLDRFVTEVWRCMRPDDGIRKRAPRYPQMLSLSMIEQGMARTHVPTVRKSSKRALTRQRSRTTAEG